LRAYQCFSCYKNRNYEVKPQSIILAPLEHTKYAPLYRVQYARNMAIFTIQNKATFGQHSPVCKSLRLLSNLSRYKLFSKTGIRARDCSLVSRGSGSWRRMALRSESMTSLTICSIKRKPLLCKMQKYTFDKFRRCFTAPPVVPGVVGSFLLAFFIRWHRKPRRSKGRTGSRPREGWGCRRPT